MVGDTTNTFHFQFGEITVTPFDFAAITGLRVGGEPIPYDTGLVNDNAALIWFLGRVPLHSGGLTTYGQFTTYWDHEPENDEEAAQMARAYLLYLFGASLFPNRRTHIHLGYLAALVDLRAAGRFDWGGAALCTLYCFLGAASHGVGNTVGGYWRVVELWAYEVLGMFPPENTCKDPNLFPRGLVWNKEYRKTKERRGEVMTFRRWLDNLTSVSVHWKCWDKLEAECLVRSREVTRSRVLLQCPLGWQWYLGDRATHQSLGLPVFVVPEPLPPRVQRTDTYTRAELEQFTAPNTNLEGFLRRTMDYDAYKERYLAMSLGVEQELQRRVAETEARRTASETRAETGGEGGRGGHFQRARGRGRGTSFRGQGRGSVEATARREDVSEAPGMPELKWEISVRDHTGARAIVDIPRLPRPAMNIPDPNGLSQRLCECWECTNFCTIVPEGRRYRPAPLLSQPLLLPRSHHRCKCKLDAGPGRSLKQPPCLPCPELHRRRIANSNCGHGQRSRGNLSLRIQKNQMRQRNQKSHLGLLIQILILLSLILPLVTAAMMMMTVLRRVIHHKRNRATYELYFYFARFYASLRAASSSSFQACMLWFFCSGACVPL